MTDQEQIEAFRPVVATFPVPVPQGTEKIYRLETNHFRSGNYAVTFGAGMEAVPGQLTFPWGWPSLATFWEAHPEYCPTGIMHQTDNNSALSASRGVRPFLIFPSAEAGYMTVATFLEIHGSDPGRWFSLDVNSEKKYDEEIEGIVPHYVEAILAGQ